MTVCGARRPEIQTAKRGLRRRCWWCLSASTGSGRRATHDYEAVAHVARLAANGKSITIAEDWGFGSATVIDQDGAHTHVGCDSAGSEMTNFEAFVSQLHSLLVGKRGLSWVKPSNAKVSGV